MHGLPQHDINGDDDDDVHNARMANCALPRIRKNKDHAGFLVLFSPKKMILVSDNELLTLFPTSVQFFFHRAFDLNHRNHLTYEDVLFGVAAMDLSTPHGGPSGELRCRYIFKFYSTEEEASLSFEEFK